MRSLRLYVLPRVYRFCRLSDKSSRITSLRALFRLITCANVLTGAFLQVWCFVPPTYVFFLFLLLKTHTHQGVEQKKTLLFALLYTHRLTDTRYFVFCSWGKQSSSISPSIVLRVVRWWFNPRVWLLLATNQTESCYRVSRTERVRILANDQEQNGSFIKRSSSTTQS